MNQPCPKCKRAIPDGKLACPYCAIRASWQAIRRHQPAALLEVAAGRGRLTIHKKPSGNHAQMFSPWGKGLAARFFCGGAPSDFDRDKKLILAPEKSAIASITRGQATRWCARNAAPRSRNGWSKRRPRRP